MENVKENLYASIDKHAIYSESELNSWALIDALRSGTEGMRALRNVYLPQFTGETTQAYNTRISRSFLYDGYVNAVDKLADKPFSREVTVTNCPETIKYLLKDMDGFGTNITNFSRELLIEGIDRGITIVLVDFTNIAPEIYLSKEDEKTSGMRANVAIIHPHDLLEVRTSSTEGRTKITMVRFKYSLFEDTDKEYGQQEVHYVKIIGSNYFKIFRKTKDKGYYELYETGEHTFDEIPLIITYYNKTGFLRAKPCMMSLAEKNIEHWQSSSEQRHILSFVRFATLFGKCLGLTNDDGSKKQMTIGPENAITTENENAELTYVEHSGSGLESGTADIKHIEEQMERLGAQPVMPRASYASATEKSLNKDDSTSSLKTWIKNTVHTVEKILSTANYLHSKSNTAPDLKVNVFTDFLVQVYGDTSLQDLQTLADNNYISGVTLLEEAQRRGKLSELVNCKQEYEKAQKEKLEKIQKEGLVTNGKKDDNQENNQEQP